MVCICEYLFFSDSKTSDYIYKINFNIQHKINSTTVDIEKYYKWGKFELLL